MLVQPYPNLLQGKDTLFYVIVKHVTKSSDSSYVASFCPNPHYSFDMAISGGHDRLSQVHVMNWW